MKLKTTANILLLFVFATVNVFAQIPNGGFENWGIYTEDCPPNNQYAIPTGWIGGLPKECTDITYSIKKLAENYPVGTGQYSILIESDSATNVIGVAETGNHSGYARPTFPISGHPASLTGYYKYAPVNGDTMRIAILLYDKGSLVSGAVFKSASTISNWTPFSILLPEYTSADSGFLVLSSHNDAGPHGNSALSIDNLNFDNLISGISQNESEKKISVYPNPFSSVTTLMVNENLKDASLDIYNSLGQQVLQLKNINGQTITLHRDSLRSGLFFVKISQFNRLIASGKLIIRDN